MILPVTDFYRFEPKAFPIGEKYTIVLKTRQGCVPDPAVGVHLFE